MELNSLVVLKTEVLQALEALSKRQLAESNSLALERKQLENEHKLYFEKSEMSQKSYFLYGRERDAVAQESESLGLRKLLPEHKQRQQKVTEK